jgi:hypothetical protein
LREKEALLFLKKKAGRPRTKKTSDHLGHWRFKIPPSVKTKFFAPGGAPPLFFKKAAA